MRFRNTSRHRCMLVLLLLFSVSSMVAFAPLSAPAQPSADPAPPAKPGDAKAERRVLELKHDALLDADVVPGEIVLTVHQDVKREDLEKALKSLRHEAKILDEIAESHMFLVSVPANVVHECRLRLSNHPYVEAAGLNTARVLTRTFNDPALAADNDNGWNLRRINAFDAWEITTGGAKIAIVDSGIRKDHEEFRGKLVDPFSVYTQSSDMQTGRVKVRQWDPSQKQFVLVDQFITEHGTHVAGTAAGKAGNSLGTAGISPDSPIMPIQSLGYYPQSQSIVGYDWALVKGLNQAINRDAKVINYSIGGPPPEEYLNPRKNAKNQQAKTAAEARIMQWVRRNLTNDYLGVLSRAEREGVIIVKSAGNDNLPAKFDYLSYSRRVISVAATNKQDGRAIFDPTTDNSASNYGDYTTVSAPGQEIWNAYADPSLDYGNMQGTSMAAPHVTGVCALMKSVDPDLSPKEAAEILVATGQRLNTDKPIGPLVNAAAAVKEVKRRRDNDVRRPDPDPPLITPRPNPCRPRLPRDGVEICRGPRPWLNGDVRRLINLWLCIALPVLRDLDPNEGPYFWDRYGRVISIRIVFTIERPDYFETRYQFLWENARTLRSTNYGTLYEFIIEAMERGTFDPAPPPRKSLAKVLRTFEYHQVTKMPPGNIANHEGSHLGFNGNTIAFAFKRSGKKEGEVWSVPFDGGEPVLLDEYPKDYEGPGWANSGMVDISQQAPFYVMHSNGSNLRVIPIDTNGRKTGGAKQIFSVGTATVVNLRMARSPFVLLTRDGYRLDVEPKRKIEGGVHMIGIDGKSTPVLTNEMIAELIGCDRYDISFSGGGRYHFDASQNDRVVAVVHISPKDKKNAAKYGSYLIGGGVGVRPFIIASKTGEGSKYYYKRITISGDGQKIAYIKYQNGEVVCANFDGSDPRVVLRSEDKIGFPDSSSPFRLDTKGKYLLNGNGGVLFKTDGSETRGLGNGTSNFVMVRPYLLKTYMNSSADRFVFATGTNLATVQMNVHTSHKGTPYITKYQLEPMALPAKGGYHVFARAWVAVDAERVKHFTSSAVHNGLRDDGLRVEAMRDDGNKSFGDIASDGIYTSRHYPMSYEENEVETRTLRLDAEAEDSDGKRHAYAIEIGPLPVRKLDQPPSVNANGVDVVTPGSGS